MNREPRRDESDSSRTNHRGDVIFIVFALIGVILLLLLVALCGISFSIHPLEGGGGLPGGF